jgi:uncharacterized protein YbjQ (UPF0145 family)|tara:strand:- start:1137 stop:1610 length:474 start_codon:yes stop_codon:yes gene_type:complete
MSTGLLIALAYGIPLILAVGGLIIGTILERRHFVSIREREARFLHCPAITSKHWDASRTVDASTIVSASTVVSLDYFKRILANLRNLFGGRVRSYETLMDRAKREAILRLHEASPECEIILNLRIQTTTIVSVHNRGKGIGGIEVLAYGTAVRYTAV